MEIVKINLNKQKFDIDKDSYSNKSKNLLNQINVI